MFSFRPYERLKTTAQFQAVYDRRRSVSDAGLIVYALENGLPFTRIGLSVSRKYGGAVQRNRLRRLFREAFRLSKAELPTGLDLVLIPRNSQEPELEALRAALVRLVKQVAKKLERDREREAKEPTP